MSFEREPTDKWRREIPGARWFKADLHVHTIDDHPGKRARMPDGLSGDPADPGVRSAYAKRFLQAAVANAVQVLGLTPHSPRAGTAPDTSVVWEVVETWNSGTDDDGVLFREKIFAVFPGFEPSLKEGSRGLHLLFLFDPEIGRENYLKLFDMMMGSVSPWAGNTLQISNKRAEDAFEDLQKFRDREHRQDTRRREPWEYLVLAPHIDAPNGLLGTQKAQVLQLFDHGAVTGLELGDDKLPEDTLKNRSWLEEGMRQHRQAFFHGSDAYSIDDIGKRHTWVKLASPRIEALRQAFIASDSRIRIGLIRDRDGKLVELPEPPDVTMNDRPWLKSVTVRGGTSFFGGNKDGNPEETRFDLSPDLTCIIGGSMTGKSTLLDGLRMHVGAPEPSNESIAKQVKGRGQDRFLFGSPEITFDAPGSDPTAPLHERWPARFFAQSELQRLAEAGSIEALLAKLTPSEVAGIEERGATLRGLDKELQNAAGVLARVDEELAETEQDHERARRARQELDAFKDAGVDTLLALGRRRQAWESVRFEGGRLRAAIGTAMASMHSPTTVEIDDELIHMLSEAGVDSAELDLDSRRDRIVGHMQSAIDELSGLSEIVWKTVEILEVRESVVRIGVERALARRGLDASKLKEFQKLNQQAALLANYEAVLKEKRAGVARVEASFAKLQKERRRLRQEQRDAFDRVLAHVARQFGDRFRARRIENGDTESLEKYLSGLARKGITQWWNGLEPSARPSPKNLLKHLADDTLREVGMTGAVQRTFREAMTKDRQRALAALRTPDTYVLEMLLDDGNYRRLDDLSGGQKVSVLLSLLLETADDRPLVIDQPEDELDNRFLWETILPALKKLKGQRQLIVATHNPNIVVNGDADMVILLKATARHGWVDETGAIEEPAVRDAIVRTVDGGDEAFRLRRRKYGF